MIRFTGKVIKVGDSYAVIIPKKQADYVGIKPGDLVSVTTKKVIKPQT